MTRVQDIRDEFAAAEIKTSLLGQKCWYGYCSVGNTFQLAFGAKVARDAREVSCRRAIAEKRFAGRKLSALDRRWEKYQGQSNLLVWCSWRLDGGGRPLTSWDDEPARCEAAIGRLIGSTVESLEIRSGWNLELQFSGGLTLGVFPDHVGPSASFDGNWELWRPEQAYLIDTKLNCQVIDRENRPLRLQRQGRWALAGRKEVSGRR